tara:strand:+ start:154 stop:525 length:372 start_codon:yes stop_codon:yes gene_type:complete
MKVVAAIISNGDYFLIAQRSKNKHLALKWEFPGGKVNKGESLKNALKREIKEELNIEIAIHKKIGKELYQDEKINITIYYFKCTKSFGKIYLNEHEDVKWILIKDMHNYDFAEADARIVKKLI